MSLLLSLRIIVSYCLLRRSPRSYGIAFNSTFSTFPVFFGENEGNRLDFHSDTVYITRWNRDPTLWASDSELFFSRCISKSICQPAKFKYSSFAPTQSVDNQQGPLCLRVLLGVFLSSWEKVLGWTCICYAWGIVRLFLCQDVKH